MSDPFATHEPSDTSPGIGSYAVTPSDSEDLTQSIRAITIGGTAGTVSYISSRDGQTYATASLPVGTYAVFASRIRSTGTTATDITGWV